MKRVISSALVVALTLLPASAFASESTNVWASVGTPSAKQESSNVWASVGSSAKKEEPTNVWAAYDPDAEPVVSTDAGASTTASSSAASIDWTIGQDDGTPTLKTPDSANIGKVTSVSNPAGTLPSSTQGVVTNAGYTMPYAIKVDLTNQVITIFSASEPGVYNVIEKQFICSTGTSSNPTPTGVFSLPDTSRKAWRYFKTFDTYVRYAVHIKGNYFFHSLLYSEPDLSTRSNTSYRNLGKPASHGCIRMLDEDVKWMAENCLADTMVFIMNCEKDKALTQSLLPPAL
ncbi:MAG: L,D-transpeptidase [Candidatus Spyradocola sp.]|jgi:lipoprotein-anchoring transpeptidase ErfK/SrfK